MFPFFSIIIPTLNEEKNLPILLSSIERQTNKDFQVIVVDSQSTDKTKTEAEKFIGRIANFQFVTHRCKNVSQGRNYGAKQAKGKYLIFFDADVEPEKKFISEIKKKIIENHLDATTVWNRAKTNSFTGKLILNSLNIIMSLFQKIKPGANGPCIIIEKKLFNRINGFDEEIVFGEDFDLIQRAVNLKAKFQVFRQPILYVSSRRFEKEGLFLTVYKSGKALIHQLFLGPIKQPIFQYEMGGQYYIKK